MNVQYRYEIGLEEIEASDNVATIRAAYDAAIALQKHNPQETIYVYDRMAHPGKPELWHLKDERLVTVHRREAKRAT